MLATAALSPGQLLDCLLVVLLDSLETPGILILINALLILPIGSLTLLTAGCQALVTPYKAVDPTKVSLHFQVIQVLRGIPGLPPSGHIHLRLLSFADWSLLDTLLCLTSGVMALVIALFLLL